jgi:hypothetical protein
LSFLKWFILSLIRAYKQLKYEVLILTTPFQIQNQPYMSLISQFTNIQSILWKSLVIQKPSLSFFLCTYINCLWLLIRHNKSLMHKTKVCNLNHIHHSHIPFTHEFTCWPWYLNFVLSNRESSHTQFPLCRERERKINC